MRYAVWLSRVLLEPGRWVRQVACPHVGYPDP